MTALASTYDVFLSFRGADTRSGFTGYLYKALSDKGIHTFIDDEELQRGNQITPSLLKAIQDSRIAIVVLSNNYASSSFCLDELVHILHCSSNNSGALVLPVFYEVDPSDVRHQRGNYGEALAMHEEKYKVNVERLDKWKMALQQVANLSGWHFKHGDGYEYNFIESIVGEVSNKINRAPLHVVDCPVGLVSQVSLVKSLLYDGLDDGVCMVGIHGIGGIGKTTLARAVSNLVADQFEGFCFLEDVRKKELVHLQKIILSEIIGENDIQLGSVNQGISILKHRLGQKKVLMVLDDVDEPEQLRAIVGGLDWFGIGSKVIITTRDQHLLKSHGVERTYEVEELNREDAFELLRWNAFKNDEVDPSYENILKRIVTYASGLPLALKVIGSNLFGKRREEWESTLDQYERIPNKKIQDILKVSFDSLEEYEKKFFLDIAFCFNGYELPYVKEILYAHHGVCPKYGIGVLIEKSLIKIDVDDSLTLHDLIEDMGKEIVRQEAPEMPGNRSRLWFHDDIVHVLEENMGTSAIQIIILDRVNFKVEVDWDGEAFKKMKNLKTLIIRGCCFSKGPKHLPKSLRVLEWRGYPSPSLPSNFYPKKLVKLDLPHSCLTSVDLLNIVQKKNFMNLTAFNFDDCQDIIEIPDVSGVPNLKSLSFCECNNLIKIHKSIGFLGKLRRLNATGCQKLRTFPPIKLTSLEYLGLSYCKSLERFPEILGNMESITWLHIFHSSIKELPFSIHYLTRLRDLRVCVDMDYLSSSIAGLKKLERLDIIGPCIEDYESSIFVSEYLTIIPESIKECGSLRELALISCKLLEIKGIPPNLESLNVSGSISLKVLDLSPLPTVTNECRFLRELDVSGCENLQQIIGIPCSLRQLYAYNCKSLRSMSLNQDLHDQLTQYTWFHLPSISFMFPPSSLCYLIGLQTDFYDIKIIINDEGKGKGTISLGANWLETGSIHHEKDVVYLGNGWNDFKYSLDVLHHPLKLQIRLHVVKQESCVEHIRFTNPYKKAKLNDYLRIFNWWH